TVELHTSAWMRAERAHQTARDRWQQARERLAELAGAPAEDPDALPPGPPEVEGASRAQLERRRHEIEAELERIGSVDMQAIEAYEQALREFEAARTAHADLVAARRALEAWQLALEEVAAARFRQTLEAASREFDGMIRRLFGGGQGQLRLDGSVEGGRVEMEVHLPAKRPQPAVALSGGERALVFAAFIFALQRVRPSPVCVLDELDAALDEPNLERLVGVVQELAQDRQILFITHRQRTMEAATSLFGVTVDEQGVSRLLVLRMGDVPRVFGAEVQPAERLGAER
ncbi:MAG TPA: AAA family ATPase, partial [Limnochordales bacterium]